MGKQHTPEQQKGLSKGTQERDSSRAGFDSTVPSRNVATDKTVKKKIDQPDDAPSVTVADEAQLAVYMADAEQPVVVAQLSDEISSVTGEGQASGADMTKLALASGWETDSDVGQAPAESGNGWWWLGGGLAAIAVGGGIAASGGSGGGSSPTATTVNGTVTDGPVQGSRIYYDVNGNGIYDAGTDTAVLDANGNQVVTDVNGSFSFTTTANPATLRLVANGGIDTVTGEAVTVDFAAPAGYTQINPITSAIAAYMESHPGATAAQAEAAVETAVGLPDLNYAEVNLFDPPAEVPAETVLAAQQAAAILATTAIVVQSSGIDGDPFAFVAANLGSGGDTSALVAAVIADPSIAGTDTATRLNDTVTAINEAVNLDAIGDAVNSTLYPDPPALGDYSATLNENSANGTAVVTVAASDPEGDTVSYAITAGNASGAFAIDSATGLITVADAAQLNFEANASFSLTIEASDGTLTDTGTVTVNLTDLNDIAPVITSGGTGSVAENAAASTVIYDAAATDPDAGSGIAYSLKPGTGDASLLNIDSTTGQVTLKNPADFEAKASYGFTVIASDGTNSSERAVTVSVTDLNDNTPVITSGGTGSVAENAATSNVIYDAAGTDADAGSTIAYSLRAATGDVALLNINAVTGEVTLKNPADFETKQAYTFTVIASDGTNSSEQAVTVSVSDLNDNTPVITSGSTGSVVENLPASTLIYDAAATDADAGTTLVYSLKPGTGDVALLNIDTGTGQVTLKNSADYETKTTYSFTVITGDGVNSSEQAVTVTVVDANESVVVESTGAYLDLNANGVKDAEDTTAADFTAGTGNVDLAADPVTIHINDVPDIPIDLTGFTSNDRIEIDVASFNGVWMQQSPANRIVSLQTGPFMATDPTFVYLQMDNSYSYSVFFEPQLKLTPAHQGALAFYNYTSLGTLTFSYLAYWNDSANPLLDLHNILPGIGTSGGIITAGTTEAMSALNQGVGHGVLIDFIWTPPFPETAVVVESDGAWVDSDADGVHDAEETTSWAGGMENTTGHQVTIHFNNVPAGDLDLSGFGSDDLIEIDVQAFINNGHNALDILTRPNVRTLDEFQGTGSSSIGTTYNLINNMLTGFISSSSQYVNQSWYSIPSTSHTDTIRLSLNSSRRLYFSSNSNDGSTSFPAQLATGLPSNMSLQQMVDFVNLPVTVVVERDGAYIDANSNRVHDLSEVLTADFGVDGNADLSANIVTIHFNDAPLSAIDLTGFGTDDKIELDVASLWNNGIINRTAAESRIATLTLVGGGATVAYRFTRQVPLTTTTISTTVSNRIALHQSSGIRNDFNGNAHSNVFGISFSNINTAIAARTQGVVAYWNDTDNALNDRANLVPNYPTSPSNFYTTVLAAHNANHYPGLVEFVWPTPLRVVVDDVLGNVGMFIDANANGVRDSGENTLALLGQTEGDVAAFNTATGTTYGSQAVDLADEQVYIHFNDLPTGAWVPDLSGFTSDDRLEIDIAAMRSDSDFLTIRNQNGNSTSSATWTSTSGNSGITMSGSAVFRSNSVLKFGHKTYTGTTFSSTTYFTATAPPEGTIGINADALAANFEQVIFVTQPMM